MTAPRLSVILPCHRVTGFLPLAVASVLSQTWTDLELILVDDGASISIDELGAARTDPRLICVRHPRTLGIAAAVRAGVGRARGEFLGLLDHDDLAMPRRFEQQLGLLLAQPQLGLVSGAAEQIDGTGRVIGREFALFSEHAQQVFSAYSNPAPAPSFTGRREVFQRFAWRDELRWACDFDFLARAVEAWPMRGVPDVVLQYRHHAMQTTVRRRRDQVFHACLIRLLTARRRAGHAEQLAELLEMTGDWRTESPEPWRSYAWSAERAATEGFWLLAVYLARKRVSVGRGIRALGQAATVLVRALRRAPAQRRPLARMFFTGPLRTHRLV